MRHRHWHQDFMGHHFGRHGHRTGRGFGPFLAGLMGEAGFGRGRGWGRRVGSGDLQLVLLHLISQKPRHGYEIIKAIEELSFGFYSPSPGVIYPALTYLEEAGYASVAVEGTKKLYAITDEGRAYLAQHQAALDSMFEQVAWVAKKMSKVRDAFSGGDKDKDEPAPAGTGDLSRVWHELRATTAKVIVKSGAKAEKQVVEVLEAALHDIKDLLDELEA